MANIRRWYSANNIDHSYRIGDLTQGMLGKQGLPDFSGKAMECGVLMRWAHDFAQTHRARLRAGDELYAAGEPLIRYYAILKECTLRVPLVKCQELLDCVLRHVHLLRSAHCRLLPKHHLWAHMTLRVPQFGNPIYYSTFLDETLNKVISTVAVHSHPSRWDERIFERVDLRSDLFPERALR